MGDSRPTSSASSRQEESIPYVNRMEGELGDENPEVVGDGTNTLQNDRTMAHKFRDKQNRTPVGGEEEMPTLH